MMQPIKLGFIGCGGHSARHAKVVRNMPEMYKIVGALDTTQKTAENFLSAYNPSGLATTHIEELLTIDGLEAVFIGTPHKYHLDFCEDAVSAGKHILCEKPLWEGNFQWAAECTIDKAIERGLVFSSCHLRRFEKEYIHMKDSLPAYVASFGRALEIHFQFFYHKPATEWKMSDSLLLDHMNHEIDLVHFLFGYSPTEFWRLSHGFDEYRVAGKTSTGLAIWFSGYRRLESRTFRNELEIVFEKGRVRTEVVLDSNTGLINSVSKVRSFENDSSYDVLFSPHSYDDALVGVMKNFAAAIRGKEKCYLTPRDLLVNTAICNDLILKGYGII